jgi:hypothetical protein
MQSLEGILGITVKSIGEDKSWDHPNEDLDYHVYSIEAKLMNRF